MQPLTPRCVGWIDLPRVDQFRRSIPRVDGRSLLHGALEHARGAHVHNLRRRRMLALHHIASILCGYITYSTRWSYCVARGAPRGTWSLVFAPSPSSPVVMTVDGRVALRRTLGPCTHGGAGGNLPSSRMTTPTMPSSHNQIATDHLQYQDPLARKQETHL